MKARLLFPGAAVAIGVIAFAVGYRTPGSLRTLVTKVEQAPGASEISTDHASAVRTSSALSRDDLQVEGFAKIGFAEIEELLMTASPQLREQWAQKLGALPDTPLKPIGLTAFYTAWLDLKPEEALRSLRKFPDLVYRMNVFDSLSSAVSPALLPDLMEVISELSETERHFLLPSYLTTLAQTDPVATARFMDSHPKLVSSSDAVELMSAWTRDDIDAATKWLEASQFFTNSTVLRSLVDSWFAKNPAAARNYVLLHKDNAGIGEAAASIAVHLFETSPGQTREFIMAFDDYRASSMLRRLVTSVNDAQVADVVSWISTFPTSVADSGVGYALGRWAALDSKQALDWVRAKPAAERATLVVQMIRSQMAPASPEMVALAYTIHDAQKRDEALVTLVRSLSDDNGDPTEQIRALGLPASQTNHLLELRSKPTE